MAYIDVVSASKKSPAIDDMRKRIVANDWDETRLTPEEDALVEGLYPDLHDKMGKAEHAVLEAERVQDVIEQTLRPVDISINREFFELGKKLTSRQMRMSFAELVSEEVLCPRPDPFVQHTTIKRAVRAQDDGIVELPRDIDGFYLAMQLASRNASWGEDDLRELLPWCVEWVKEEVEA